MNVFYIHYTGFFLTYEFFPGTTLPYILSTESSFYYLMLERYYSSFGTPFGKHSTSFNADVMEHIDYYLLAESPVPINYLFYINHKDTEYSTNMFHYEYLLE